MEFSSLALLLVVAALFGILSRRLKQPLLVGFLFAGIGLSVLGLIEPGKELEGLSQIGVTLLLFLVGLEMNVREIPTIGKVAAYTGLGQIFFTSVFGFFLSRLLGFSLVPALYFAIALSFSSTIIMVKLLSEKNDLGSLYGKISLGFLLVQDFVAIIILMFLAGLGKGGLGAGEVLFLLVKALFLFSSTWILARKVLPTLFERFVAESTELIFIVSIAWALGVAALVQGPLGFTLEIGGFLAGLALSNLPEHLQIASRTKPLRDFFLTIFFLLLGTRLVVSDFTAVLLPAVIFSFFVLVGNPMIIAAIMGFLGYKRRTSFKAGLTVAQISEFSFVIAAMGLSIGHLIESEVATIVLVGVITMSISTYMIVYSDFLFDKVGKFFSVFERKKPQEAALNQDRVLKDHLVLVGFGRTGKVLAKTIRRGSDPFVIVDFDPKVFNALKAQNYPVVFGDIADREVMKTVGVERAKMVISTTGDFADNLMLLANIRVSLKKILTIFTAKTRTDAVRLYEKGVDLVVVPETAAGEYVRHILLTYKSDFTRIKKLGKTSFTRLLGYS